ncbi:MAG TPA: hypothetical protein VK862_07680 [Afifellaceae bacterium]|nr:hypothetical protein [Afifellaceae bacterium]
MNSCTREELRIRLSITLAMLPSQVRRDLAERLTSRKDPAIDTVVGAVIAALEQDFHIEIKPHSAVQPPVRY